MATEGNLRIAMYISAARWEDLPAAVQHRTKICLREALGAILSGASTPEARIAAAFAASQWSSGGATIILQNLTAGAAGAAYANATAASAKAIGDETTTDEQRLGRLVVPTALVVAEQVAASGKSLLEAIVAGYEIGVRARCGWAERQEFAHSAGSWGSLACAAAAAHLMRLDLEQIQHALGIADYHAPNARRNPVPHPPSMIDHAAGWEAMNGVTAAQLAQRGFTGIPSILGCEEYHHYIQDIGQRYWLAEAPFLQEQGEQEGKFRRLASSVIDAERIEPLIDLLHQVEDLAGLGELTRLLKPPSDALKDEPAEILQADLPYKDYPDHLL